MAETINASLQERGAGDQLDGRQCKPLQHYLLLLLQWTSTRPRTVSDLPDVAAFGRCLPYVYRTKITSLICSLPVLENISTKCGLESVDLSLVSHRDSSSIESRGKRCNQTSIVLSIDDKQGYYYSVPPCEL
jgi:hypothetical protein